MWLTIYKSSPPAERTDPQGAPDHCPHPAACLRLPLAETRSFREGEATQQLMVASYRRLMARQCACNGHCEEVKI